MRATLQYDPSFLPPGAPAPESRTGELCTTPCVVDLPQGRYRVFLAPAGGAQRGDADDVDVGEGLNVYRRAPGAYVAPTVTNEIPPGILIAVGIGLTVAGASLAASPEKHDAAGAVLYHVSMKRRLGEGWGGGTDWRPRTMNARVSAGSITASTSRSSAISAGA